jgi:hypothetical protein
MATDLQTRKTSSPSEAYLQSKFAELCARIQRVDLIEHLLALLLTVFCYAFFVGLFDWYVENSNAAFANAARWAGYAAFLGVFVYVLVQTVRCWFRRVNPYYVAHQIEQTLPDSKNLLINWLDLHDEELPTAFQKTLSTRAAEQMEECDPEQTITKRKNWILLGVLGLPALGLVVLLLLGPSSLVASLLRGFMPFYTPAPIARTQITLIQPAGGGAEISPTQSITFMAKIEGRVPADHRSDAPKLSYRYQASEDYLTQPLQPDGSGAWTTQLHAAQLRTGFSYKISAADAETPEYQVRLRTRAHVKKLEITYQHQPYRKLPKTLTSVFPNQRDTKPFIRGPIGSEVELIVHACRPWQKASVEFLPSPSGRGAGSEGAFLPIRKLANDAFACKWTLNQPGQFRIAFISTDGEENTDRDWCPIEVPADDAPLVVLTQRGKDTQLPWNGTLELAGEAISNVGIKGMTLHLRVIEGEPKLLQRVYRPEVSFKFDDGSYPNAIPYMDVIALDQFKNDKGTITYLRPGNTLEYWLEAADCTEAPNPAGNIGKSPVYKVKLTAAAQLSKQEQVKRDAALQKKKEHEKQQDNKHSQENKNPARNPGSDNGSTDPQKDLDNLNQQKEKTEQQIKQALDDKKNNEQRGGAKSGDQNDSAAKEKPQQSADAPEPANKGTPPMSPEDSGNAKDQGDKSGSAGAPKDGGDQKEKSKDAPSKGDRKDGPKEQPSTAKDGGDMGKTEPAGGTKDAGPNGMNEPMPAQAKELGADDGMPMPFAKGESQPQSNIKGVNQNGPDLPNKDLQTTQEPSDAKSKGGMMTDDAGASKGEPDQAKQPGNARDDDPTAKSKEPSLEDLIKLIERLPEPGAKGDDAGKALAAIGEKSKDGKMHDFVMEVLKKNGRDPKTGGKEKKGPNLTGTGGKSPGISDEVKTAAANREFIARIGQMQLNDWKKRVTPEVLKKAGLSDAEWQKYLKTMQAHDALVRQLNAKLFREALKKDLSGGANSIVRIRAVETIGTSNDPLDAGRAPPPPELRDPLRRAAERKSTSP